MLRDFKRPNLKAPRFRFKVLQLLNKPFYNRVRSVDKVLTELTDKDIERIIVTASQVKQEKVLAGRDGVELPEQLGNIFIGSSPATKRRNVDYKRSLELGKLVHHKNWETDGLTCNIFYTNYETKYRFKYHELWTFEASKQFRKAVSEAYKLNHTKFIMVDNWLKVSILFRKEQVKEQVKKKVQERLKSYNEFDLD
jgi:hypothetical protein